METSQGYSRLFTGAQSNTISVLKRVMICSKLVLTRCLSVRRTCLFVFFPPPFACRGAKAHTEGLLFTVSMATVHVCLSDLVYSSVLTQRGLTDNDCFHLPSGCCWWWRLRLLSAAECKNPPNRSANDCHLNSLTTQRLIGLCLEPEV